MSGRRPNKGGFFRRAVLRPLKWLLDAFVALLFLVLAVPLAVISRASRRRFDVGLGPEPLINNVYHKQALALHGYSAQTFVDSVFYITDAFDVRGDLKTSGLLRPFRPYYLFVRSLFRYRVMYFYFNGGPLMRRPLLWRLEPWLYRLAGIRTVVMPYGSDVQDLTRSPNLAFRQAYAVDYPEHSLRRNRVVAQIDLWTRGADHVLSGVEWVDYMYYWDTLMLGHFSIDVVDWASAEDSVPAGSDRPLRLLHAPNHRAIKGTNHFVRAVEELQAEGVDVELVMLERVPNQVVRQAMADADVVADQLIVGWYAMFALEAMAMGKPVICFLRPDLVHLYESEGLVERGEIPIVSADASGVKDAIRELALNRDRIPELGRRGREFVEKHHSLEYIGSVFAEVNRAVGIAPSASPETRA
jgi:glycosyltransferase involved in cell wall biosynthesis